MTIDLARKFLMNKQSCVDKAERRLIVAVDMIAEMGISSARINNTRATIKNGHWRNCESALNRIGYHHINGKLEEVTK